MNRMWQPLLLGLAILAQSSARAEDVVRVSTREELVQALRQAKPGAVISVAPGTYRGGLSHAGLKGTKDRPIVIAGADPKHPPVIEGGGSGLHLSSPEHIELKDMVLEGAAGNGLNIDDSGSLDTPAHHVVLHNLVVRDVGPAGNHDGIKLSGVSDFRIEACRVERWGTGGSAIDMVGCQKGVVRGSTFAEGGGDAANGVQVKGGSRKIAIQRCRFENAGGRAVNIGGSTGLPYFRPRESDCEAEEITVQDCEFIGGQSAVAFVGVDGAVVEHNTIYRPKRWAIRILQENTEGRFVPCRNGRFLHNVVSFRSDEVRQIVNIGNNTRPETFQFSGNAWYCIDRAADTMRLVRLPVAETEGSYGTDPGLQAPEKGDLSIRVRTIQSAGVRADPRSR